MRKYALIALLSFGLVAAVSANTQADPSNSGAAHVIVNVVPNVAINPLTPQVVVNQIQSDEFDVVVEFLVQANTQVLELSVQASMLYKHDDPTSPYYIPLKSGSETVTCQNAAGNPLDGANNKLTFTGPASEPISVNGLSYPAETTAGKLYGSSQGEFWDQSVTVTVPYDQSNEILPTGQYSGGIQLTAVVVPGP